MEYGLSVCTGILSISGILHGVLLALKVFKGRAGSNLERFYQRFIPVVKVDCLKK